MEEYYSRDIRENNNKVMNFCIRQMENGLMYESYSDQSDDYISLTQVTVNMGGKIYIINEDGVKELNGTKTGRGSSVFLQHFDEDGHIFETQYQFNKGNTLKYTEKIAEVDYDERKYYKESITLGDNVPANCIKTSVMWRD
jgi:hypothetical protein